MALQWAEGRRPPRQPLMAVRFQHALTVRGLCLEGRVKCPISPSSPTRVRRNSSLNSVCVLGDHVTEGSESRTAEWSVGGGAWV